MNWNDFKLALSQHLQKELHFEYAIDMRVPVGYHITEIKQAVITSVDCGGVKNEWTEVIVQLWVPDGDAGKVMTTDKALSIIGTVERVLPVAGDAMVKVEFGNADFDTRQLLPKTIKLTANELLINLVPDKVQCKAQDRGGSCGTPADTGTTEKTKIEMINLTQAACCTPGGGCC